MLTPKWWHRQTICIKKKWGQETASIEDSVHASIRWLKNYIKRSKEKLITTIRNSDDNINMKKTTITGKQKWEEKQLSGYFKRYNGEITHQNTWTWLRKGNFQRETESFLIAAKSNTIRTNYIKVKINNTQQNSKYRLCSDKDETINHMICKCNKPVQWAYKKRLDGVGKVIPLEEIKIWPYYQMVHTQTRIRPGKWDVQNSQGFWDTNRSPNPCQKSRPSYN